VHIFRIVLAKYPIDLVQGCSLAISNLFSTVVVYLDYGALVTKDVGYFLVQLCWFIQFY
jgi:hypothetical protein